MKKINLFNKTISPLSDGKGCPVERGGVWELPRRTPCATPSWKEGEHKVPSYRGTGPRKNVPSFRGNAESPRCCRELVYGKTDGIPLFSGMTVRICGMMIAIAALFATPSFAAPTELDKKTVASKAYVDTKQDIIPTDKVLLYDEENDADDIYVPAIVVTNAEGTALNGNSVGIMDSDNSSGFYNDNIDLNSFVPTVGAVANEFNNVWDELDTKQYIIPGGTAGNVVTYTGNEGEVGSATVSSAATYLGTTLTNGDSIANITAVETKQDKFTCAGYEPGHEGDMDYCWLYGGIEVAASCKPFNASCVDNSECCSNNCAGRLGDKICTAGRI